MKQVNLEAATFLRHAAVMSGGSILVAVTNYAFYPAIARLLAVDQFGEVQTLVSLYLQVAIVLAAVNVTTVRLLVDQVEGHAEIVLGFNLGVYYVFVSGAICGLLCVRPIASFFQFGGTVPIALLCCALVLSVPFNYWLAYMQGLRDFMGYSYLNFVAAISKLFLAIGLVAAGLGVSGAVGSIVAGQVVALLFIRRRKRSLPSLRPFLSFRPVRGSLLKPYLGLLVPGLIATVTLTFLFTADVFFIKHFSTPVEAGHYAGISSVARIVFFVCAPVSAVLLASIERGQASKNDRRLKLSLALIVLLGGSAAAAFCLFPHRFALLILGPQFVVDEKVLRNLSLAFLALSAFNALLYDSLSHRRNGETVLTFLACIAYTVAVALVHPTPETIASIILVTSIVVLAAAVLLAIIRRHMESTLWAKNLS